MIKGKQDLGLFLVVGILTMNTKYRRDPQRRKAKKTCITSCKVVFHRSISLAFMFNGESSTVLSIEL